MWICQTGNYGYIYNPAQGDKKRKILPDTPFDKLPEDWRCPICGASRKSFLPVE